MRAYHVLLRSLRLSRYALPTLRTVASSRNDEAIELVRRHALLDQADPERGAGGEHVVVEAIGRVVQLGALAGADEDEGAGALLQHEGEILAAHPRQRPLVDALR